MGCRICDLQVLGDSRLDPGLCVGLLSAGVPLADLYPTACRRHKGDLTYWSNQIKKRDAKKDPA